MASNLHRLNRVVDLVPKAAAFLVDSAGVLHSGREYLQLALCSLERFTTVAPTFLATNNVYETPKELQAKLLRKGVRLEESAVLSSGHGLMANATLRGLIVKKRCYFLGREAASSYLCAVPDAMRVSDCREADVIILGSYDDDKQKPLFKELCYLAQHKPDCTWICLNPDRYIRFGLGLKYVMGHFASLLAELAIGPFYWFGKPYENYSQYVKQVLKTEGITDLSTVVFFDDQLENVRALENQLGLIGCWVEDTGVCANKHKVTLFQKWGRPCYSVSALDLEARLMV